MDADDTALPNPRHTTLCFRGDFMRPVSRPGIPILLGALVCAGLSFGACGDDAAPGLQGDTSGDTSPDAVDSSDASECEQTCPDEGGRRCVGQGIEVCAADEEGCLVWTAETTCGAGFACEDGACEATCRDQACTVVGATRCDGDAVATCRDDNEDGCLEWVTGASCDSGVCASGRCASVCEDECTTVGARDCEANAVVTCGQHDSDSCLEWGAPADCGGAICSLGTCAAECVDACGSVGATRCAAGGVQTCGDYDADPCLEWGTTVNCDSGESCSSGACLTVCTPECTESGATDCDDAGLRRVCGNFDGDVCLEWGTPTACEAALVCAEGSCATTCTSECVVVGATECTPGGQLRTCTSDGGPCLRWDSPVNCPGGTTCSAGRCESTCTDTCSATGERQCVAGSTTRYRTCGDSNADGCFDWGSELSCAAGLVCSGGACMAQCQSVCATAGETRCGLGDGVEVCGDYNGDSCLEWGTSSPCTSTEQCADGACTPRPAPTGLLIAELRVDTTGSPDDDAFVELAGPPGTVLDGLTLVGVNGNGGADYATIALSGSIGASGRFVIATPSAAPGLLAVANMTSAAVDFQNGPDSLQLRWGNTVLAAVGYGTFVATDVFAGEGSPVATAPTNSSLARNAGLTDTNVNAVDFRVLGTPTPGAGDQALPPQPARTLRWSGLADRANPALLRFAAFDGQVYFGNGRGDRWRTTQYGIEPLGDGPVSLNPEGPIVAAAFEGTFCKTSDGRIYAHAQGGAVETWSDGAWQNAGVNQARLIHCHGADVFGLSSTNNTHIQRDGASWTSYTAQVLNGAFAMGGSRNDLWVIRTVANSTGVSHFDGTSWANAVGFPFSFPRQLTTLPNGTVVVVGDNGKVASHQPGGVWVTIADAPTTKSLRAVAANSLTDILVATNDGDVYAWDGAGWSKVTAQESFTPLAAADGEMYIGGARGSLLKRVGEGWRQVLTSHAYYNQARTPNGTWYRAGGPSGLERDDGQGWTPVSTPFLWSRITGVWAAPDESIWISATHGASHPSTVALAARWDGESWTVHEIPVANGGASGVSGFWVRSAVSVYAWRGPQSLYRFDGTQWRTVAIDSTIQSVAGFSPDVAWVAGEGPQGRTTTALVGALPWSSSPIPADPVSGGLHTAAAGSRAWLATASGQLWGYSDGSWSETPGVSEHGGVRGIHAAAADDVWLMQDRPRRFDGTTWSEVATSFSGLYGFKGAGNDVRAIYGGSDVGFRWNGSTWLQEPGRARLTAIAIDTLAVAGPTRGWLVGDQSRVLGVSVHDSAWEATPFVGTAEAATALDDDNAWVFGDSRVIRNGGSIVSAGFSALTRTPTGWVRSEHVRTSPLSVPPVTRVRAAAALSTDDIWLIVQEQTTIFNLWRGSPASGFLPATGVPSNMEWLALTATPDGALVALARDRSNANACVVWTSRGGSWGRVAPGAWSNCPSWTNDAAHIWAADAGTLAIAFPDKMWHLDSGSWTSHNYPRNSFDLPLKPSSLGGPSPDNLWAVMGGVVFRYEGDAWVSARTTASAGVQFLTGRPGGNVIFAGSGLTGTLAP